MKGMKGQLVEVEAPIALFALIMVDYLDSQKGGFK